MDKLSVLKKKVEILEKIQKSNNRLETLKDEQETNKEIIEKIFDENSKQKIGR